MPFTIDYYFSPQSPWSYLGHARFAAIAAEAGARVRVLPADFGGKVFPVSGGLPLAQRAVQRQAYRLVELRRFAEHLRLPLKLHPAHFPVDGNAAARLVVAVDLHDGADAAMRLAHAVMKAVWVEDRDIADGRERSALLAACGLDARRIDDAEAPSVQAQYDAHARSAVEVGVFGAPSYVVDGEIFWGQDRLDFLQRRLAARP
jgi:2-hydroxychromene-2-carboxylate isomerase